MGEGIRKNTNINLNDFSVLFDGIPRVLNLDSGQLWIEHGGKRPDSKHWFYRPRLHQKGWKYRQRSPTKLSIIYRESGNTQFFMVPTESGNIGFVVPCHVFVVCSAFYDFTVLPTWGEFNSFPECFSVKRCHDPHLLYTPIKKHWHDAV